MSYLISQIFLCVLLAFILGFLLGWLLRHMSCRKAMDELRQKMVSAAGPEPVAPVIHIPGYPVEDIEGIGSGFGKRLRAEGIETTDRLLLALLEPEGVSRVCRACEIDGKTAYSWATMADLLRVPGIGGQWSELLWRCDVKNVQMLARESAAPLLQKMEAVNAHEHRVHELPGESRVKHWIEEAGRMPKLLPD
jgi:hypothetical protein